MSKDRSSLEQSYTWSIDEMFDETSFETEYQAVSQLLDDFESEPKEVSLDNESIAELLNLRSDIAQRIDNLIIFSKMKLDENNAKSAAQVRFQKARNLAVKAASAFSFIEPKLIELDSDKLLAKLDQSDNLANYDHYLKNLIRQKAHYLSAEQEALLAELSDVSDAAQAIFNMLTNADFSFADVEMPSGEYQPLNQGNFMNFLLHKDRAVRQRAYHNLYQTYKAHQNSLATAYAASVKKDVALAKIRKFNSSIEMSLFEDNIAVDVYDHLVSATSDRIDLYHRYLDIRRREMDLATLKPYDLYVPLTEDVDMTINFDDGFAMVKKALQPLGEKYGELLDKARRERWIDVYTTEGKSAGAYSWGSYQSKPFILLNYHDKINDVSTLAHELGHSMHSYLTNQNQPYDKAEYSLFVAEVASTVNESIMIRYMIEHSQSDREKRYLINTFLEIFRATIFRQTMFAEFERTVHAAFESDQPLGVEALNEVYSNLQYKYFGDKVDIGEDLPFEWSRIPHFYRSFYVYSYATGLSAALNISERILKGEAGALQGYLDFLSAGSSLYPLQALKLAGIDMTNPATFYAAFDVFESLLDQFESLADD